MEVVIFEHIIDKKKKKEFQDARCTEPSCSTTENTISRYALRNCQSCEG